MGEKTGIEWCRNSDGTKGHTFNPWWGCQRVSPGCDHCYAATWAKRWGDEWGASAPPRQFGDAKWAEPLRWDRAAAKAGIRARVFCASMGDVFERRDNAHGTDMDAMRERLWVLIEATPHLDWLLLTKRPENVLSMIPECWRGGLPDNVWMGTTAENQRLADERIPHLLRVPARVRFLSCEPLLGPLVLPYQETCCGCGVYPEAGGAPECCGKPNYALPGLSWVITGGETGPGARPSHPDWFRSVRDQCEQAGIPYFHKQNGVWAEYDPDGRDDDGSHRLTEVQDGDPPESWTPGLSAAISMDGHVVRNLDHMQDERGAYHHVIRVGKKVAGRLLDGREHNGMPEGAP